MKWLIYKLNVTLLFTTLLFIHFEMVTIHTSTHLNTIVEKLNKLGLHSDKITCKCTIFTNNSVTSPNLSLMTNLLSN